MDVRPNMKKKGVVTVGDIAHLQEVIQVVPRINSLIRRMQFLLFIYLVLPLPTQR